MSPFLLHTLLPCTLSQANLCQDCHLTLGQPEGNLPDVSAMNESWGDTLPQICLAYNLWIILLRVDSADLHPVKWRLDLSCYSLLCPVYLEPLLSCCILLHYLTTRRWMCNTLYSKSSQCRTISRPSTIKRNRYWMCCSCGSRQGSDLKAFVLLLHVANVWYRFPICTPELTVFDRNLLV